MMDEISGSADALLAAMDCRIAAELPPLLLSRTFPSGGHIVYRISAQGGPMRFQVSRLGLFTARGTVRAYSGTVSVDPAGGIAGLDLSIEPDGIQASWGEAPLVRPASHPIPPLRFRGTATRDPMASRPTLRGLMTIGGTSRLLTMDVHHLDRAIDAASGSIVATFEMISRIHPSHFDLGPGRLLTGDAIAMSLRIAIEMDRAQHRRPA